MFKFCAILFVCIGSIVSAEILVPVRTIRAKEIVRADDVIWKSIELDGAISELADIVGKEARVALYPGRAIRRGDVVSPAIIDRNDMIMLVFTKGGLRIMAEGRSLGRGAAGDLIRVMNVSSRTTISGRIQSDGSVEVQ